MKTWQIQLGGWGSILWAIVIFNIEHIRNAGWLTTYQVSGGYMLGFITAFVGYLFWEIVHGRWHTIFGNERGFWRIFSAIPLLVLTVIGVLSFIAGLVGSQPWHYNLSFVLAGVVVSQGLVPIINEIDGKKP